MKYAETTIQIFVLQSRHDKIAGNIQHVGAIWFPILLLPLSEHQPRDDTLPFLVRVVVRISDVVALSVVRAIETVIGAASNIDSICKAIFAQSIGKVP